MKTTDFMLLEFAIKSKAFAAELSTNTQKSYYPQETRIPMKILTDYFKTYRSIPSFEIACEYANSYPNAPQVKEILSKAYSTDKATISDGDFPFLVDKLKKQYNDVYVKERVKHIAQTMNGQYDIEELNEYLKKTAMEIGALKSAQMHAHGSLNESAQQRLVAYKQIRDNPDLAKGVMSGFKDLDAITNGFRGGEVILISGPTSSGKSILLMNMALNAWLGNNKITTPQKDWAKNGKGVWFITIENPKDMLERRIDSNLAEVVCNHIRDGQLTPEEEAAFRQALKFQYEYGNHKRFEISDFSRGITMAAVEAEYEKVCSIFEPDLIVIDYLGIMKAVSPTGIDWMDIGSISEDMHSFARVVNKPILTASQMKGAMRTHQGMKQIVGDPESIARSKMVGDNINFNLQLEKGKDFHIESFLRGHVAKNRDGETGGEIILTKEYWRMKVCDPDADFIVPQKNSDEE